MKLNAIDLTDLDLFAHGFPAVTANPVRGKRATAGDAC
jgi:hypothetical protein